MQALVKTYDLPPGLRFDVGGQIREQQEVNAAIIGALLLAVIFIYLVLASQFGSFFHPVAIMVSLPLSIVGVMLALLLTADDAQHLLDDRHRLPDGPRDQERDPAGRLCQPRTARRLDRHAALLAAGQVRLRPILMTTAAMIFGMLPLAIGLGEGAEQQAPMGRAIIGGVITSTLLTLVVVPVIYTYIDAFERRLKSGRPGTCARPQPADMAHGAERGDKRRCANVDEERTLSIVDSPHTAWHAR